MQTFLSSRLVRALIPFALLLASFAASAQTSPGAAATAATAPDRERCEAMRTTDFSHIPDASTQIQSVTIEPLHEGLPPVCKLQGTVGTTAFMLALPLSGWNGKYAQGGCGGACGVTTPWWCFDAVNRGYACMSSDMGHRSGLADWQWASGHIDARVDFGYRSTHVVALAGKAIAEAWGGRTPAHAYFMGCSTGGRQAYVLAQRFPRRLRRHHCRRRAAQRDRLGPAARVDHAANMDADGRFILEEPQARLLHAAVVEKCDLNDGLRDGLIGDPRRCTFDPGALACKPGADTGQCLTPPQVEAARRMYQGPVGRDGRRIGTQGGVMRGSELNWIGDYMPRGERQPQYVAFMTSFFRYAGFDPSPSPDWQLKDLDFDRDRVRMDAAEMVYNAQNPDLREFKKRGGRIVAFQGWSDTSVVPSGTVDYYETVARTMGRPRTARPTSTGSISCPACAIARPTARAATTSTTWRAGELGGARTRAGRADRPPGEEPGDDLQHADVPDPEGVDPAHAHRYPYPDEARYKGRGDPNDPASWDRVRGTR